MSFTRPLLIFYEHPDWFRPLFAELDRRGTPYLRVHADGHAFDPARQPALVSAAFNRMSPSAWRRGRGGAIFATHDYLAWLESHGIDVFNGSDAFRIETSKASQIGLLSRLGIRAPRTNVVSDIDALPQAAETLAFPIVVKPNIGGSGAGIVRFESPLDLSKAVREKTIATGLDGVLLAQEYHQPPHPPRRHRGFQSVSGGCMQDRRWARPHQHRLPGRRGECRLERRAVYAVGGIDRRSRAHRNRGADRRRRNRISRKQPRWRCVFL